jgi:hypothetical protein
LFLTWENRHIALNKIAINRQDLFITMELMLQFKLKYSLVV